MFLLSSASRRRPTRTCLGLASALCLLACGADDEPTRGVLSTFDVSEGAGPLDAPFPIAHRARPDGSLRIGDFPNDGDSALVGQLTELLETGRDGFSLNGAIWIPFEGAIDVSRLPADPKSSTSEDSPVFLVNVSTESPRYGERVPIETAFKAAAETYSPANLLVVLPYPGIVLERQTRYAVVVRRGLGDADQKPLYAAESLDVLLRGDTPSGPDGATLAEAFAPLRTWLLEERILPTDVAAATVFTTGDPLDEMIAHQQQIAAAAPPAVTDAALEDSYEHYCVIRAKTSLPVFQRGPKPYAESGTGGLVVDDEGALIEQERDAIELVFTIPKTIMPEAGYPLVLYAAGAEGEARQVVDRTASDADPGEGLGPPGRGPARFYGARGIAALGFPAPLAWDRHPDDEGGLTDFWNLANVAAFRGNIRQGILDFATLLSLVETVSFDAALCPEASSASGSFQFDPDRLVIHGHGTGSTIGSAVVALERDVKGVVLSGAGGSWISNVVLAEAPLTMSTVMRALLEYDDTDEIDRFDPALTLFQTALESIETMNWGAVTVPAPLPGHEPKDVLLIEGVVDSHQLPRMVNAYAMSAGLDLVEPEVEPTAREDYALVGGEVLPPPITGNVDVPGGDVTAVTIQRAQNDEDGHDVAFELDDVKYRYGCFVETLVFRGLPTVPGPNDDPLGSCP